MSQTKPMVTSADQPPAEAPDSQLFLEGVPTKNELPAQSTAPKTIGWLTRDESARLLGVAVQTIKSYEKRGLLHPLHETREDSTGREQPVTVHDPRELLKVRELLQAKQDESDTGTWLTRIEATDALSISIQTLKNYEQRNLLHPRWVPRRDKRGHEQKVIVYDPKELSKLPRGVGRPFSPREDGELTARCFELIEQGKTDREIIIQLRSTVDKMRELREHWINAGGASLMINNEAKNLLETMLGPFTSVTELVELVAAKLKIVTP